MSKPTAFGLFQLVWRFFTSGLVFFVHLDLATLEKTQWGHSVFCATLFSVLILTLWNLRSSYSI